MSHKSFHLRKGEKDFGYAQAVRVGSMLFVSGCMSVDDQFAVLAPGDMAAQLEHVYADIRRTLRAFEADLSNVVKETIYVTDMAAFLAANGKRVTSYAGLNLPAVTAVEVRALAFTGQVVEIEVIAAL
jgi:enamine deaminase RidA (YjgF/YER057c/UK114 family)